MWSVSPEDEYLHRRKKWPKKHKRELEAVHDNLDTFLKALIAGACPIQAKFGFVHPEPLGVLAIDQKGGGQGLKETRLYIFPDVNTRTVRVITLGDKSSQSNDIALCKEFVKSLRAETDAEQQSPVTPTDAQETNVK